MRSHNYSYSLHLAMLAGMVWGQDRQGVLDRLTAAVSCHPSVALRHYRGRLSPLLDSRVSECATAGICSYEGIARETYRCQLLDLPWNGSILFRSSRRRSCQVQGTRFPSYSPKSDSQCF